MEGSRGLPGIECYTRGRIECDVRVQQRSISVTKPLGIALFECFLSVIEQLIAQQLFQFKLLCSQQATDSSMTRPQTHTHNKNAHKLWGLGETHVFKTWKLMI